MADSHKLIAEAAAKLVAQVPPQTAELVARALEQTASSSAPSARTQLSQSLAHAGYRNSANEFLDEW